MPWTHSSFFWFVLLHCRLALRTSGRRTTRSRSAARTSASTPLTCVRSLAEETHGCAVPLFALFAVRPRGALRQPQRTNSKNPFSRGVLWVSMLRAVVRARAKPLLGHLTSILRDPGFPFAVRPEPDLGADPLRDPRRPHPAHRLLRQQGHPQIHGVCPFLLLSLR